VRFSEIARILLVRPIVPMFMYTQTAASNAVVFWMYRKIKNSLAVPQSQLGSLQVAAQLFDEDFAQNSSLFFQ
jgi:hypothetical protein